MGRHPLDAAALERAPRPRAAALVARLARDRRCCCSPPPGSSPSLTTPDPHRGLLPGPLLRRPRSATSASSSTATASCWRCTASRAWPASWPAPRSRRSPRATPASGAGSTTRPARSRSASWSLATLFSLTTQAWALGSAASTLSAQLDISPALLLLGLVAARGARAVRALPPARRVDDRRPPGGLERAARRHLRDRRDRDPDHRRGRRRRGLGLAARAACARGVTRPYAGPSLYFLKRERRATPKGPSSDGRHQARDRRRLPGRGARVRAARAGRLLGAVVRAVPRRRPRPRGDRRRASRD